METTSEERRRRNSSCDLKLVAKGGKEFKAHRDVLNEASPFFEKLLKSDMKENNEGVVRLELFADWVIEDVLQFIYNGNVEISTTEKAEVLITAADYLALSSLKTFSGNFLEKELSPSNCSSTYRFAQTYHCAELLINSWKYIQSHILVVSKSEEFLNLESQEIENWISSDDLGVTAEEDVFEIILRWIHQDKERRKEKLGELFRHLRLVLMSRNYLKGVVVTNEIVTEDVGCVNLALEAITWLECKQVADNGSIPSVPRKAMEEDALIVLGRTRMLCYLPSADKWFKLPNSHYPHYHCIVSCQGRLYSFSGYPSLAKRYIPLFNHWTTLKWTVLCERPLSEVKFIVVVKAEIFFIFDTVFDDNSHTLSGLYKFNTELELWSSVPSFQLNAQASCCVSDDNYIYEIGGRKLINRENGLEPVSDAARFNIAGNSWESIAQTNQARYSAFGTAAHEKIFIAGGFVESSALESCEVYDKENNEWQFIAGLRVPCGRGLMVNVGGTLFVLGNLRARASRFNASDRPVDYYDPETSQWKLKTTVPLFPRPRMQLATVCSARLLKATVANLTTIDPFHIPRRPRLFPEWRFNLAGKARTHEGVT